MHIPETHCFSYISKPRLGQFHLCWLFCNEKWICSFLENDLIASFPLLVPHPLLKEDTSWKSERKQRISSIYPQDLRSIGRLHAEVFCCLQWRGPAFRCLLSGDLLWTGLAVYLGLTYSVIVLSAFLFVSFSRYKNNVVSLLDKLTKIIKSRNKKVKHL